VWWDQSDVNVRSEEYKFSVLRYYFLCRVRSTWDAFSQILAVGGVRGLWKGSMPNVQRAALVNLGDLTTYDTAKRFILTHTSLTDSHVTHILSR
jgi:solute carrier family 25 uncoupling protein 27